MKSDFMCESAEFNGPKCKTQCADCKPGPSGPAGGETQEFILRAMAKNYADGNSWDDLDRQTCILAADEIASLRKAISALAPVGEPVASLKDLMASPAWSGEVPAWVPQQIELPAITDRGVAGQVIDAAWETFGGNNLDAEFWQLFSLAVQFTLRAYTAPPPVTASAPSIVTCCVTGAIPGDGGACGDCDPCIQGETSVPEAVKRLIAEKSSLFIRIGELEDTTTASAEEIARLLEEARDMLMERIHGNSARSPGHNARLKIEEAIALLSRPQPAREGK